ncbi:MAG: hypothetical protein ACRDSK_12960 [Actinophytocola sp.]|uniref:hypothetical protein n=1 Tax=Actinophytocola sp. TaxID=1872138 RepID=UPI003D6BC12D
MTAMNDGLPMTESTAHEPHAIDLEPPAATEETLDPPADQLEPAQPAPDTTHGSMEGDLFDDPATP